MSAEELTTLIVRHGYLLLALWAMLDQVGLPAPAIPLLIGAGALAGTGQLDIGVVLFVSTAGAVAGDLVWYEAGRRRGGAVLKILCKVALEPDSCVRKTKSTFARYGERSLLVAKLIPAYQSLASALAGMSGMSVWRFLLFDIPGALLWSGLFAGVGYLLHDQIDRAIQLTTDYGFMLFAVLAAGLAAWIAWKLFHRWHFRRSLRIARIEPHELKRMLDAGHDVAIVDLRESFSLELDPHHIPGARVLTPDEIDEHHADIPRDRDVILYCT
jgi:membrane protein DedA with SNARE-associated domain